MPCAHICGESGPVSPARFSLLFLCATCTLQDGMLCGCLFSSYRRSGTFALKLLTFWDVCSQAVDVLVAYNLACARFRRSGGTDLVLHVYESCFHSAQSTLDCVRSYAFPHGDTGAKNNMSHEQHKGFCPTLACPRARFTGPS